MGTRGPKRAARTLALTAGLTYVALSCILHGLHDHSRPGWGHSEHCSAHGRCAVLHLPDAGRDGPSISKRCCQPPLHSGACAACSLLRTLNSRPAVYPRREIAPPPVPPAVITVRESLRRGHDLTPGAPRAPPAQAAG